MVWILFILDMDMVMAMVMVMDTDITMMIPEVKANPGIKKYLNEEAVQHMATGIDTGFKDLIVIQPAVFEDERGYFYESYNKEVYAQLGITCEFVQDNQSLSNKGVLRGLHFQNPPFEQSKLVRVIKGSVLDITLDIRKNSPTFGKHFSIELTEKNKTALYVPPGFAHGFVTLEDNTVFFYKCSAYYNKASEGAILWNDEALGIDWKISKPLLSEKDKLASAFNVFNSLF